eukprot:365630-Chlamydomonas_euryale.AAC.17
MVRDSYAASSFRIRQHAFCQLLSFCLLSSAKHLTGAACGEFLCGAGRYEKSSALPDPGKGREITRCEPGNGPPGERGEMAPVVGVPRTAPPVFVGRTECRPFAGFKPATLASCAPRMSPPAGPIVLPLMSPSALCCRTGGVWGLPIGKPPPAMHAMAAGDAGATRCRLGSDCTSDSRPSCACSRMIPSAILFCDSARGEHMIEAVSLFVRAA